MKLKIRVLASIMSILTLSSFSQLIGFAEGDAATQEADMYAKKGDNVQFNSDSIVTHAAKETNADLAKIETIKKFAAALGTDTLYNCMQENNYNVKIKFDDEMCSIIDTVSEDAHISSWDCSKNNVQIINGSGDNLKAHIGVEFEKECGITEISLSNSNELADIDLPAGKDTGKILLQLAGGKIETNVNLSVLNKLYDNGKVKIGVAKVFITGEEFINSYKEIADKIKDYTKKTKVYADKFGNTEITGISTSLVGAADKLPESANQAYDEYSKKVAEFVEELKLKQGNLNEMKIDLCISNKDFRENLDNFVNLNQQLTEKVNTLANKPVVANEQNAPQLQGNQSKDESQTQQNSDQSSAPSAGGSNGNKGGTILSTTDLLWTNRRAAGSSQGDTSNSNEDQPIPDGGKPTPDGGK